MTHAALIIAHKNKEQLIRLIKAVSSDSVHVFIHLDKNWKLSSSEIKEIEDSAKNVFVIKKRIHGELDNWSLVQIALNLIDAAAYNENKTGEKYSYFMLLSGQDYPIKSKRYIAEFLEREYPKPLVDYSAAEIGDWIWGKFQLTKWENKIEQVQNKREKGLVRSAIVAFYLLTYKLEKFFKGIPWDNLQKTDLKIYGGSQWWILPHGVIDYIKEQQRKNKKAIAELKRAWTPDESFFQTLALNSPYKKYILENDDIFDNEKHDFKAMTYCNFITPTKGFRGHPHVITVEDYDRIMAKKALFARKFDTTVDGKVLDMIDREIADE